MSGPTRKELERMATAARNLRRFFNSGSDDLDTVMRMEELFRSYPLLPEDGLRAETREELARLAGVVRRLREYEAANVGPAVRVAAPDPDRDLREVERLLLGYPLPREGGPPASSGERDEIAQAVEICLNLVDDLEGGKVAEAWDADADAMFLVLRKARRAPALLRALPPEDGEREALIASLLTQAAEWEARPNSPEEGFTGGEIAEMYLKAADLRKCAALLSIGATVDALEIYRVEKYPGVKFVLLDDVRALLRQPPPPPAVGVSKATVEAAFREGFNVGSDITWDFVEVPCKQLEDEAWEVSIARTSIEALPEAAPGEREAVMAAVFRCGYNCGIDRAQDFARETASDLGPGGSVKPPAHPDAIAVLRAYARHLEEVVRQEGCPDAAVGALSADEVDRLLTGGHLRAAAPPSGVDREEVAGLQKRICEDRCMPHPEGILATSHHPDCEVLRRLLRALPEAKP